MPNDQETSTTGVKRGRGRPKKSIGPLLLLHENDSDENNDQNGIYESIPKRARGRSTLAKQEIYGDSDSEEEDEDQPVVKRGRGRPKKVRKVNNPPSNVKIQKAKFVSGIRQLTKDFIASVKVYTCDICDVEFNGKDTLMTHRQEHKISSTSFMANLAVKRKKLPLILVHGGAGEIPDCRIDGKMRGVCQALRVAYDIYNKKGCLEDALVEAVKYMEKDPVFNAGYGSVLNEDGFVEAEALIMEGRELNSGAVTGLEDVLHPIEVARSIMHNSKHVILTGDGAKKYASNMEELTRMNLVTLDARKALQEYTTKGEREPLKMEIGCTVGAIGVDENGHMISCTSTGGITGKAVGRVGDTPIPGAGGYADDKVGVVSVTGYGDAILKYNLSQRIMSAMEGGYTAQEAATNAVEGMRDRLGHSAGAIVISHEREPGVAFTSKRMAWAYRLDDQIHNGINQGDHFVRTFDASDDGEAQEENNRDGENENADSDDAHSSEEGSVST